MGLFDAIIGIRLFMVTVSPLYEKITRLSFQTIMNELFGRIKYFNILFNRIILGFV
jgi:hypothetical protein